MDRISMLISIFGVIAGSVLLIGAVREYQAGSSVLWAVAGGLVFLAACLALVRDARRLRASRGRRRDAA